MKINFEKTWCDYLTPCPHKQNIMVGEYDCYTCKHCKKYVDNGIDRYVNCNHALFNDPSLQIDWIDDINKYRITFFKDCHWYGEIYYDPKTGKKTTDEGIEIDPD